MICFSRYYHNCNSLLTNLNVKICFASMYCKYIWGVFNEKEALTKKVRLKEGWPKERYSKEGLPKEGYLKEEFPKEGCLKEGCPRVKCLKEGCLT